MKYTIRTKPVLNEIDLCELEYRYGKQVRFVVEDMMSGKGERWDEEKLRKTREEEWYKEI